MQIKLAISNLDPRPARLSSDYNRRVFCPKCAEPLSDIYALIRISDRPYGVSESLTGFKRAAATHGWKVRLSCSIQ